MAPQRTPPTTDNMLNRLPKMQKQELLSTHHNQVSAAYVAYVAYLTSTVKDTQDELAFLTPAATITPAVEHSVEAAAKTQIKQVLFANTGQAEDKNSTKPALIEIVNLLDEPDTDDNKEAAPKPKPPKREHGLIMIKGFDTNRYLKNRRSDLTVVFVKSEDKSLKAPYSNGMHLLATIRTLTSASQEAMDSLKSVKNTGSCKNFRAIDITGFLERNDVTITAIADSEGYDH
jgi:hypothetical protein